MKPSPHFRMDTTEDHHLLNRALEETEQNPLKSVFDQPFQQPERSQVNDCLHWLDLAALLQGILLRESWGERSKRIPLGVYHLKHVVEQSTGRYVRSDAFACAALAWDWNQWGMFPALKFRLPRTKDVRSWNLRLTQPTHNLLQYLAGRNISDEKFPLHFTWNGGSHD